MDYKETITFLYSQLPMFHRIGKAAYKNNLDNAHALDELCGFPHKNYLTIHVAGTNGKGSVSHMLASVLHRAGYKTGLFTSPHLIDFRERIRINGVMITEDAVTDFVNRFENNFGEIKPSFFEMTSALAFDYFNKENVDIAVIETGLGGRLDSTNIIRPVLSVITNISYDHTDILGDTYGKIAAEKAGIIKQEVPVVIGETHPDTRHVFEEAATERKAAIQFADQIYSAFQVENEDPVMLKLEVKNNAGNDSHIYSLDLPGLYQQKNICTVLACIDRLTQFGIDIQPGAIEEGLKHASKNTGLKGRWQILSQQPLIICDTGHNEDGIGWVTKQIKKVPYRQLHFVFGVVKDKDIAHILPLLPVEANYYFTKANIPRAMDEQELKQKAFAAGLRGEAYSSVRVALETAKKRASVNDLIFIGGSTFIVADALQVI